MKPTILEELWNGQVVPCEHIGQNDPEVEELAGLTQKNRETLEACLSEEQKKQLEKFICCYDDYHYLLIVHAFRMGFSLSGRLTAEMLAVEL